MAGLCSRHHPSLGKVEGCVQCHGTMKDLFPDWWEKKILARISGQYVCKACGFKSYNTVGSGAELRCPKPGCEALKERSKKMLFLAQLAVCVAIFFGIVHIVKWGLLSLGLFKKKEEDGNK